MWVVLGVDGGVLRGFPAGADGWRAAVAFAMREGGEFDVVFDWLGKAA